MSPINILFFLAIGLVLFIIGRELIAWYFKINKIVSLLGDIEENTRPKDKIIKNEAIGENESLIPYFLGKDKRSLFGKDK